MQQERKGNGATTPRNFIRWSKAKRAAFLDHLAATCNVCSAARAIGVDPKAMYRQRRRDPAFAASWQEALALGYEMLETRLVGHALAGDASPNLTRGEEADLEPISVALALTLLTVHRDARGNPHLPRSFVAAMQADYGGTRIGRQELEGELIDDLAGALWTRAMLDACRVSRSPSPSGEGLGVGRLSLTETDMPVDRPHPNPSPEGEGLEYVRVVVGVDPPAGSADATGGDACGIVAVGLGRDGFAYVIEDASVVGASPEGWARAVAGCAARVGADRVIAEKNQGGEMVRSTLLAADAGLPVKLVHASRGKVARAEPVAALYERGKAWHVGAFPALEDELCGLVSGGGYEGPGRSPDRADALVWAMTELMLGARGVARVRGL